MNSKFLPFFSISLLHEYFLSRSCLDFELAPADDCMTAFRKGGILGKTLGNRYQTLIQANGEQQPFCDTPAEKVYRQLWGKTVFRFYLRLKQPLFVNYTNLDPAYGGRQKFYFSNLSGNKDRDTLALPASVIPFTADTGYIPGNLAKDAKTGTVWEALKKYTGKKKAELSDPHLWAPKEAAAYASAQDLLEYTGGTLLFRLSAPATKAEISILGFNFDPAKPAFDQPLTTGVMEFETPQTDIPVSFEKLPPGKYLVQVNKDTKPVYYDPAAASGAVAGVVEIYNHLPGSNDYALLTDDEQIRPVNYQILFPARRVLWKYIRKDGKADSITDLGASSYQFTLKGNEFISSVPIPLSEGPLKTLKLLFNTADYQLFPLPNPGVERLKKCEQDEFDYFCSEINLSY